MRLSDDELTALLAEHRGMYSDEEAEVLGRQLCQGCWNESGARELRDCQKWRLATEVRDLRAVKDAAVSHDLDWQKTPCFTCQICHRAWNENDTMPDHEHWCPVARYEEGGR